MQANLTNTFIRPYAAMIYQTNDGGPGKGGPLAQVWRWLCKFTAESLPQPQGRGSTISVYLPVLSVSRVAYGKHSARANGTEVTAFLSKELLVAANRCAVQV